MARFNSATSIFNSNVTIFNKELAKASSSLSFSIDKAILGRSLYMTAHASLNFDVSPHLDLFARLHSEYSLLFEVDGTVSGTANGFYRPLLKFTPSGNLRGATFLSASTGLNFFMTPKLNAKAYTKSNIGLNFLVGGLLDAFAGRTSLIDSSISFDMDIKLRTSPWQGISEIGNAVYQEGVFNSNYGRSPYREDTGL